METTSFSEGALSSLTEKINAKLHASKSSATPTKGPPKKQKAPKTGRQQGSEATATHSKPSQRENGFKTKGRQASDSKPNGHSKQLSNSESQSTADNRKRLRNGKLKAGDQSNASDRRASGPEQDRLREAIGDLGGTAADYDLIQDVDSGSEVAFKTSRADKKLTKELKDLVQELGIANAAEEGTSTSEDAASDLDDALEGVFHAHEKPQKNGPSTGTDKPPSRLRFSLLAEWHNVDLPAISAPENNTRLPQHIVDQLHQRGKDLLHKDNEIYTESYQSSSSAHRFYSTIMTSGTLTDKISALTLSVQESPLHNMKAFESLLVLAKKRSRAQAIEVLNALKDLFGMGSLLPSTRHLRPFFAQPGLAALDPKSLKQFAATSATPKPLTDLHIIMWAYEDWLKTKYFEVLQVLETWLSDEVLFSRQRATDMTFELLREKPEQEANLLRLLVNKLGDREKKIASRASYNILQLQIPHPSMASNIINTIESDILFRPGQSLHAKYYAMITLNQTVLSSKEEATVRKILDIYFAMFLSLLKGEKTEKVDTAPRLNKKGEKQGGAGGKPGRMAMEKKAKAAQKGASAEEAVREKTMSAVLTGINRAIPFTDTSDAFFARHLDTLFQVTHSANFNTSVQSLMLIQQLCESHQSATDRFYRTLYESLLDPRLLTSSKQILYLNLLYRALRADLNVKRIQAFAKRLLQCVAMHQPPFACGVIYLLRELEQVFPGLALLIDQPEEDMEDPPAQEQQPTRDSKDAKSTQADGVVSSERYDGKKRAPEHSNADRTCLWELDSFLQHFHPSVSLFANRLLTHEAMPPKPDLDSHTLTHFLDRFVYRNPKKVPDKLHGSSIMQPLAATDSSGLLIGPRSSKDAVPVNTSAFAQLQSDKVKVDEVFFHKYFNTKAQGHGAAKAKKDKRQKDAADSDDEEAEIWQALVDSRPEIEGSDGDADEDVDMDMDVFSDVDDGSDDGDMDGGVELNFSSDEDSGFEAFEDEDEGKGEAKAEAVQSTSKRTKRRKQLKSLPMFASADDYADMVDDETGEITSL